ncbi:MAG: hypothetical protein NT089_11475 [Planctomycetia bacterium]|nr:hypothetical protein [Planctomycetia bacterium]
MIAPKHYLLISDLHVHFASVDRLLIDRLLVDRLLVDRPLDPSIFSRAIS